MTDGVYPPFPDSRDVRLSGLRREVERLKRRGVAAQPTDLPTAVGQSLGVSANFAIGTFAPNIDSLLTNSAGASVFSIDGTNLYQCDVAKAGTYLITYSFACSASNSQLSNCLILTGVAPVGGLSGSNSVEMLGSTSSVISQANVFGGSVMVNMDAGDHFYQYFTINKALSSVGPLGWSITQVSTIKIA